MICKKAIWVIIAILISCTGYGHKRALFNIVIDTDGGQDDFRAITLFCASNDFNINAISVTDGVLHPDETAAYISMLMKLFGHEGIPIGIGKDRGIEKQFRNHALPGWQQLFPELQKTECNDAIHVLRNAIVNEKRPTVIVALGPLGNIADILKEYPELKQKIGLIIWYNDAEATQGYNYESDKEAFRFLDAQHMPLKIVKGPRSYYYSEDFFAGLKELSNVYASAFLQFNSAYTNNPVPLWDDLCALYLTNINFFSESYNQMGIPVLMPLEPFHGDVLAGAVLNVNKAGQGVVFNDIPSSGHWIMQDIRSEMEDIVRTHGVQEFKIVAMTSEFHSHLGAYSIAGAKMGLRVMEYFHAGLDEITITSFAGFRPPVSCLNDGLQFGTGATLGYGSIFVDTVNIRPAARITYNNRSIEICLKPEIQQQIETDIGELIRLYGLETELYWEALRKKSIGYWREWNRRDMFNITSLN